MIANTYETPSAFSGTPNAIIRLLILPLNIKSTKSNAKMQEKGREPNIERRCMIKMVMHD